MASPAVTATTTIRPNEPAITALVTALVSCPPGPARFVPPAWAAPVAGLVPDWLVPGWLVPGWLVPGWPGLAAGATAGSPGRSAVTARTGSITPWPEPGPVEPRAVASIRATTWAGFSRGWAARTSATTPET